MITWLVDFKLAANYQDDNPSRLKVVDLCKRDPALCLNETNNFIDLLVQNKNKIKELEKLLGKEDSIVEEGQTLLPIIRRLLQMLKDSPND